MKVYKKNSKIIVVNQEEYCYIVKENVEDIILRVYSTDFKSTYFDVVSYWVDYNDLNFYEPKTVEKAINFALNKGWNSNVRNRKAIFTYKIEISNEIE